MGQTKRKRKGQRQVFEDSSTVSDSTLDNFQTWTQRKGFHLPLDALVSYNFSDTGRGLKTLELIKPNDILIKLPIELLITTQTVFSSRIGYIFSSYSYSAQTVLAAFLVFEIHLGKDSDWRYYINTLPKSYTNPDFCTSNEKQLFPKCISDPLKRQTRELRESFSVVLKSMGENAKCRHCDVPMKDIFRFQEYKWAFYTVNTRCVYINPKPHEKIKDENNIALAPFLDLFNHSFEASVKINESRDYYEILTFKSYQKDSQVFINYGSHSSLKLYLEYGFFVPRNPLDEVYFDFSLLKSIIKLPKKAEKFISKNDHLTQNLGFCSQGLNYNAKVLIYISNCEEPEENLKTIYGGEFHPSEIVIINSNGLKICHVVKNSYRNTLERMKRVRNKSVSFSIGISLIEEYISILESSSKCILSFLGNV